MGIYVNVNCAHAYTFAYINGYSLFFDCFSSHNGRAFGRPIFVGRIGAARRASPEATSEEWLHMEITDAYPARADVQIKEDRRCKGGKAGSRPEDNAGHALAPCIV